MVSLLEIRQKTFPKRENWTRDRTEEDRVMVGLKKKNKPTRVPFQSYIHDRICYIIKGHR